MGYSWVKLALKFTLQSEFSVSPIDIFCSVHIRTSYLVLTFVVFMHLDGLLIAKKSIAWRSYDVSQVISINVELGILQNGRCLLLTVS